MEDKAIRGIPWTMLGYALSRGASVVTMLILARLLLPSEFGLVALAAAVISVIIVFQDLGLGATLIVRQDWDRRAEGTVLTMMLASGAAVMAVLVGTAPLLADLFGEPRLAGVLAALSSTLLLGSIGGFHAAILQRELAFPRRFVTEVVQAAVASATAISLAIAGAGVWSLVVGQIVGAFVYAVATTTLVPYRVAPSFDRGAARDALHGGVGFLVQGGASYAHDSVDNIVVGAKLGTTQLGYYSMAFRIGDLPYLAIVNPVAAVTFPGFARMRHRGEDIARPFLASMRMVALATLPFAFLLSGAADPFTRAILGDKWIPMIGVLSVLGLWAAPRVIYTSLAWVLNSVGHAMAVGAVQIVMLAAFVPALLVGTSLGGITTVAWVLVVNTLLTAMILAAFAQRDLSISIAQQWEAVRPAVLASIVGWLATRGAVELTTSAPAFLSLCVASLAGLCVYLVAVAIVAPGALREGIAQIARVLRRAPAAPAP